jgi:hypothetical protein
MSPGHAVPLCRRLPDFVVSADATTRCGRERTLTAMESAIRARFVRDSFHSLITGLSPGLQCSDPAMCGGESRALRAVRVAPFDARWLLAPLTTGSIRRGTLASALHAHAGLGYPAARRAAHAACGASLLTVIRVPDACRIIGIACNGNAIGGTFHQRPRTTPCWWPAQRLPGMVEAAILRDRDARGSRRCFARTARAKRAARTLICYPLSASPPFMQKAAG